jgi:NAD(P)-dependent dehydrogenase (short-subunit alcohol dehydrogenase family)
MKVVLYGASGMLGSRILRELVNRGHTVTAVVRNPSHITEPKVTVFEGDILDEKSVIATAQGAEVAISAYGPGPASSAILVRATTDTGQRTAPSRSAPFPHGWRGRQPRGCPGTEARRHPEFSGAMETHLSSPCRRARGAKNLRPRLDQRKPCGPDSARRAYRRVPAWKRYPLEDYAAALVDEVEKPRHVRQRFAVAYCPKCDTFPALM